MSAPLQIFGLVAGSETQKAAIDAHCFGDCGKVTTESFGEEHVLHLRVLKNEAREAELEGAQS